jgi:hypothetical protein
MIVDLLKRFTPTPIRTTVLFCGTTVRLETNCSVVNSQLQTLPGFAPIADSDLTSLIWRIVVEPCEAPDLDVEFSDTQALGYEQLWFIPLSRQSFLACDERTHEGISFLSESLAHNQLRFQRQFVPALFSLIHHCTGHELRSCRDQ